MPKHTKGEVKTRDRDIRRELLRQLEVQHPHSHDDLILEEFGCNSARIDVAVVNGSLHGYEIKSDCDSTARLAGQLHAYEGVFDYLTIVVGRRLFDQVKLEAPKTCGLIVADSFKGEVILTRRRKARQNTLQRHYDLARMLWRDEALRFLRRRDIAGVRSRWSAEQIWRAAALSAEVKDLAEEVRLSIKRRGGSGFVKSSEPSGGSCTTGSTVLLDHYSANLNWLLSTLSVDPLR